MRKTGGYVAIIFGVFMGVGVLASGSGKHGSGGFLFALFVFGIGPMVLGILLVAAGRGRRPSERSAKDVLDD